MNNSFKFILILGLLTAATNVQAIDDRPGAWLGTFGRKTISDNLSLWSEAQLRYNQESTTMAQTLFRGGLLYNWDEDHEFGFLMAYVQSDLQKEYRPTLQYVLKKFNSGELPIVLRSRLEFRDLENLDDNSVRFRLMLRTEKKISDNVNLVFWDEPFLNLTRESWTGNQLFDRNRAFIGARKTFANFSVEAGYMNQFVPRATDLSEHLLVVYINY